MPNDPTKPNQNLASRTMSGLAWSFSGHGFQLIFQFVTLAILARLLSPSEFGVMAAAMVVINFSELFAQIGTGAALVQFKNLSDEHIRAGFLFAICIGIVFLASVSFAARPISSFFRMDELEPILRALAIVFVLNAFRMVPEALLQRNMQFKVLATSNVLSYAAGYSLVGIPSALLGFGTWALVMATITQSLCKALIVNHTMPHARKPTWDRQHYLDLIYFGGGFATARVGNFIAIHGDNFVIARILGADALGYYSRAYQLMSLPITVFGNVLDTVLFPAMATVQDDGEKLARVYRQGIVLIALLTVPASVLLYLLAPDVILLMFGPQWADAVAPFRILAVAMLFRTSYRMSDSLAKATGQVYRRAWRQWVFAACVLTGAYFGTDYGILGVAVGIAAATFVNFILMASLSLARLHISWREFLSIHFPALLAGTVTLVTGSFLIETLKSYDVNAALLIVAVTAGVAVSLTALMVILPKAMLGTHGREIIRRIQTHYSQRLK